MKKNYCFLVVQYSVHGRLQSSCPDVVKFDIFCTAILLPSPCKALMETVWWMQLV